MFTPNYPGAVLSGRAESSHPHIRRPSVPDPNCNKGTLLLTFISLMTWLPNQSFPVISLTKHNLTLESQYCASISHLAGLIVHSSELSEFSQSPVEVIIELLNCFDSLLSARNVGIWAFRLAKYLPRIYILSSATLNCLYVWFKYHKTDDQKDGSPLTQSFQNLFVKAYTVKL